MSRVSRKSKSAPKRAAGEIVSMVGGGYTLIRTGQAKRTVTPRSDTARELLPKAGRALAKPGITKYFVFRDSKSGVFAYSVYSKDPSKVVRKSADGKITIGRVVGGKFKA